MSNFSIAYTTLQNKLIATQRREAIWKYAHALLSSIILIGSLALMCISIEALIHGSIAYRTAIVTMFCVIAFAILGWFLGKVLWHQTSAATKPTIERTALRVGKAYDDIRDMLLNAMQLVPLIQLSSDTTQAVSPSLATAVFDQVAAQTINKDFNVIIDKQPLQRSIFLLLSLMILGLSVLLFAPLRSAATRLINYQQSYLPPAPYRLEIQPRFLSALRGENVRITIRAIGTPPSSLSLALKETQQNSFDTFVLPEDSAGYYHYDIIAIKQGVEFYAESAWLSEFVRTDIGKIVVSERPSIRSLSGRVLQPSYSGYAPIALSADKGDIQCLVGSQAEISITANKAITSARLLYIHSTPSSIGVVETDTTGGTSGNVTPKSLKTDTTIIPMNVQNSTASTSFRISTSGQYYIDITDEKNLHNIDPIKYSINVSSDGYPTINLTTPSSNITLGKEAQIPILGSITDDFGFSRLVLHYRLAESRFSEPDKKFSSRTIPLQSGSSQEISYVWNLNSINISPDDVYEFYLEVFDNDIVRGPKSAKTGVISARLPSLDEVFKMAQQTQNNAVKDLEQVMKKAEEVTKEMEQLQRDMSKQQRMQQQDWNQKKKMEELMKSQAQMEQKIEQVQQKLDEMTQMLQENKSLSPETLQKYQELQKLMKSIDSKELRKAMERMQEAMKQMSPEEMQNAMKNAKFSEEDFKKQIERTMQMLKRIQSEQKIDELTKRADELERQQKELEQQANNTNPNDKNERKDLANKQDALKEDLKKLGDELKDLQQMMKEAGLDKQENVSQEFNKAIDQLQQKNTEQQMQQSEQNLENGDMQQAKQNMRNASANMKNFSQSMKKMKQEMKKNLQRETMKQMQQSLSDMNQLSKKQEQLMKDSQQMDPNSTRMSQNSVEQQKLREQITQLANRMNQLSQKSFAVSPEMGKEIGDAMKQMQDAQQSMEQRNPMGAAQQQQGAMASMNQAAQQMQGALQKMAGGDQPGADGDSGSEGGDQQGNRPGGQRQGGTFMQRLQQAANMQQGINQMMQQMGKGQGQGQGQGEGQGEGQGLSQQQREAVGRMAAQQGKVQKSMEELAREQKDVGGEKKALGNLEKLAKDMQDVLSDMQSGSITQETKLRQERILSRLLDASRSMNERDIEKTRESRAGIDMFRRSPGQLNFQTTDGKKALQDLMRSMQQGYTKDYELLIRRYYEQLQQSGTRNQ